MLSREELQQLQLERLQSSLNRAYKNVSFYRKIFDEKKIVPEDVSTLEQFKHLPFTNRKDLHNNYPYGLLPCRCVRWCVYTRRLKP